ncbi:MAG TPA: pilin [Candidatus Saccharimonadales bacterium]|nr:pilin [Candidatus Saccharimonadales bacterium]
MKAVVKRLAAWGTEAGIMLSIWAHRAYAQVPDDLREGITASRPDGATESLPNVFKTVANTLIFLVGAIAVIVLIIGGLRYVLSAGDPAGVKSAKDTILYAIIGIIVAILAFAAVNFVIDRFQDAPTLNTP